MELSPIDNSRVVRNRKQSTGETDETPKIDISIPGLNKVVDRTTEKPARIIWMITLLICAIACTYLTVDRLIEYFKYPTASKTVVEQKKTVQFPSLTVCQPLLREWYTDELKKEIINKCQQKNVTNCDVDTISIRELGINLQNVWDRCNFVSVNITDVTMNTDKHSSDSEIIMKHTSLGPCATIIYTKKVPYFSIATALHVHVLNKGGIRSLVFLPHSEKKMGTMEYELLNYEVELPLPGYLTQIKLREEIFELENIPGRECYDQDSRKKYFEQSLLNILHNPNLHMCRLPYLSSDFPECDKLTDVQVSFEAHYNSLDELNDNLTLRLPNKKIYADYQALDKCTQA